MRVTQPVDAFWWCWSIRMKTLLHSLSLQDITIVHGRLHSDAWYVFLDVSTSGALKTTGSIDHTVLSPTTHRFQYDLPSITKNWHPKIVNWSMKYPLNILKHADFSITCPSGSPEFVGTPTFDPSFCHWGDRQKANSDTRASLKEHKDSGS